MIVSTESDLIVKTLNGMIKGKHLTTVFGKEVKVFHRIPYMKSPVGKLRFKDPQPVENWINVLDCTVKSASNVSYEIGTTGLTGDEDSLYLNVYTRNLNPASLAPVMVWIHGGGFVGGSSNGSPDFLLEKNIVFCSMNYRLGPLGFLSFDDPDLEVPGNAGLKDQTMALKWIKMNAHVFGGDPNNITIFGESAGGASVHYHLISELSKDLFHKAIPMSGVAINEWARQSTTKNLSLTLAKQLGWQENEGAKRALEILQNADVKDLLEAVSGVIPPNEMKHALQFIFVPSVEPYVAEQSFLNIPPNEAMENAWGDKIPIIISETSAEGLIMFMSHKYLEESQDAYDDLGDFQNIVDIHLNLENESNEKKKFGASMKKLYYENEAPSLANKNRYVDMMGDKYFLHGIQEVVITRVNNPVAAPTYYYRFDFDDPFGDCIRRIFNFKTPGVSHATDTCYIFKDDSYHQKGGLKSGSPAIITVERMVGILTSFAATGNPNCSEIQPIYWEPVTTKTPPFKVLNISSNLSLIDLPETCRLMALRNIYKELKN